MVFNSPGANANAVKELVITGMLLASRKVVDGVEWCKTLSGKGAEVEKLVEKGKSQFVGPELQGKTLGVVGLGAIGVLVANAGVALGMDVLGYDPYISVEHAWKLSRAVRHSDSLDEVLKTSDYLTVHVPLIDATRGMINAQALAKIDIRIATSPAAVWWTRARPWMRSRPAFCAPMSPISPRMNSSARRACCASRIWELPRPRARTTACAWSPVRWMTICAGAPSSTRSTIPIARWAAARSRHRHAAQERAQRHRLGDAAHRRRGPQHRQHDQQIRGAYAYTVVELDKQPSAALMDKLAALDTTYRVRLILP